MDDRDIEEFHTSGFVVLRGFFEPFALAAEMDVAFARGFRADSPVNTGTGGNAFPYVPIMSESTPVSLALLDPLAAPATRLLSTYVLPTRPRARCISARPPGTVTATSPCRASALLPTSNRSMVRAARYESSGARITSGE